MYRKVEDFLTDWATASKGASRAIEAITDEKINVAIVEGHNSLGFLGWHLVQVNSQFASWAGITVPTIADEQPTTVAPISVAYKEVAAAYTEQVTAMQDADLERLVPAFGTEMPLGSLLRLVITHQTHHVGQMTVLLRQAGLTVPPVMGPTKEMM